jgi:4-hydroxy-2-oxoheptanedioate aldolase
MSEAAISGSEFKQQLRAGQPKLGLFLNSHSPTVAEQLSFSGYDWLLVDTQHGPMGYEKLSAMLSGISNGGAKSIVRVGGYSDRPGIQQALDLGADGVLIPYINTAEEARQAVSCAKYPTAGTRSVAVRLFSSAQHE